MSIPSSRRASTDSTGKPDLSWFIQARYGLFIHWGMYSIFERGEQVLFREHLVPSEYRASANRFRPSKFDPADWAQTAKAAGMKYAILTTKHHDGFCLWNTGTTEFNSARTGLCRDYVHEYVKAFRRAGLRVGLYFSTADWSQPAYFAGPKNDPKAFREFIRLTHRQVNELCTSFGKIDILWFDGVWPYTAKEWRATELLAMIRRLQPGIIINDRVGLAGDIATPEQAIPEQQFKPQRPWETCLTSTERWWGWHAGEKFKTAHRAIRELCLTADVGGNLVYNVGPKPDGTLPALFRKLMAGVADWMQKNREAIHGTSETICETTTFGLMTCKPGKVYLHVLYWPSDRQVHLAGLKNKVLTAGYLATGRRIEFRQTSADLYLTGLPSKAPDSCNTVIELDVVGVPESYVWARERVWTGALEKSMRHAQTVAARQANWSRT